MSAIVSSWFGTLAQLLLRHKLLTGVVFTTFCVAIGAGVALLEADFSARAFFAGDGVGLAALDEHQSRWGADDAMLVVTVVAKEGSLLERERLDAVARLGGAIASVEGVSRALGMHNVLVPRREGEVLAFRSIRDALPDESTPEGKEAARAFRAQLLHDPMVVPTALSSDGKATGIAVELGVPPDDIAAVRPVVEALEALFAEHEGNAGLSLGLAGVPVVRAKMLELILWDQVSLVPLAFALMGLLLVLVFRRFHGVVLPLLVAAIPAILVMGVMGYTGEPVGVINQVYFTLLPVIAVSGGIHLLSRYYEEATRLGLRRDTLLPLDRETAVATALRYVGGACLFSYLTTVVGMLSLQTSSMPILRSFGFYSAAGVAFAWLTLIILVPLVLSLTRGRVLDPDHGKNQEWANRWLERLAGFCLRFPKSVLAGAFVIIAVSLGLGNLVVIDNSVSGMLRPDHPTTVAGRIVDDQLLGLISLEVGLAGDAGAFDDPAVVTATLALEDELRALEGVRMVQGPGGFVKRTHEALTGEAGVPESRELLAQLAFLQDGSGFYSSVLSEDRSHARVVVRTADVGGRRFAAIEQDIRDAVERYAARPEVKAAHLTPTVTGTASLQYGGVNRLAEDLRTSLVTSWIIILSVILLIFRSVRIALLSVLPNALPLITGYGLVGLLGWPLEPGPAVVFVIALGLSVDGTIHVLVRTAEEHRRGVGMDEAVRRALVYTGRPVIITSVILAAGFALNMLSSFPNNARVGALGAFVVLAALLGDLFLVPALLKLIGPSAFRRTDHDEDDAPA